MYKGEEKAFKAEEISSMVLIKMKETAQAYLGGDKEVKRAVVTVPAYFVSGGRWQGDAGSWARCGGRMLAFRSSMVAGFHRVLRASLQQEHSCCKA